MFAERSDKDDDSGIRQQACDIRNGREPKVKAVPDLERPPVDFSEVDWGHSRLRRNSYVGQPQSP